jgi:hypothetical protein
MSRIGNKPIPVPAGVKIAMVSDKIDVQGPKGKLSVAIPRGISFEQKDGVLNVKRESDEHRAVHGLARWSPTRFTASRRASRKRWTLSVSATARNSRAKP